MYAHIDADAFFASVLQRRDPRLLGKPLLALGMGGGCVISASYEAKAKGVKTGMRLSDALKLIPNALHMPSDFHETGIASAQIEEILGTLCPAIEQMSVDEWFLDLTACVGGVPKDLDAWALMTRKLILDRTALSMSVGVAPTKLLAKMASEFRKPGGITVVTNYPHPLTPSPRGEGGIESFLRQRPAAAIPGIGRKRSIKTDMEGWATAWDIAQADPMKLKKLFGKQGPELQQELLGNPLSFVVMEAEPPKSVSRCRSFRATSDRSILWGHVLRHLEYTVLKMRRHGLACRGLGIWLRNDRYAGDGKNIPLPQPMCIEEHLQPYVRICFDRLFQGGRRYTQVGLCLWHLSPQGSQQFSLFKDTSSDLKADAVQETLDTLHEKFGRKSITRAAAIRVDSGTRKRLVP